MAVPLSPKGGAAKNAVPSHDDQDKWATIIEAMALLTHRKPGGKGHNSPHAPGYLLGKALCDGGAPRLAGRPGRPSFSELRLAGLCGYMSKWPKRLLKMGEAVSSSKGFPNQKIGDLCCLV